MSVIVGLTQDGVQILQPLHDADGHLAAVGRLIGAGVQGGPEALADFLDSGFELFT